MSGKPAKVFISEQFIEETQAYACSAPVYLAPQRGLWQDGLAMYVISKKIKTPSLVLFIQRPTGTFLGALKVVYDMFVEHV